MENVVALAYNGGLGAEWSPSKVQEQSPCQGTGEAESILLVEYRSKEQNEREERTNALS